MTATEVVAPGPLPAEPRASHDRQSRLWFIVFLVGLAAALPFLLWCGRKQWFFLDEWAFLVNRRLTAPSTLFEAHNGHWVTVPAILYRILFRAFGLGTYAPFLVCAVLTHLAVVVLMWLTMRRLKVHPAIATTTALPFVVYGAGLANIVSGFQIALTGSIVFGLAHLLLATDDAPSTRRDIIGIGCGLVAIMCSAVGIPMVIGVALAALMRRGWRAAAVHAIPLGAVYIAWYVAYARDSAAERSFGGDTAPFVWHMFKGAFVGLGQNGLVAVALVAVAAIGVAYAVRQWFVDRHGVIPSVTAALVVASVAFGVLTAFGRADVAGVVSAASGRYVYVVAALLLPVVALGGQALSRRWLWLGAVPLVLLLIGLPTNVRLLKDNQLFVLAAHDRVAAVAHSPFLDQLPSDTRLFAFPDVPRLAPTAGFLRHAVADGKFPAPHDSSPALRSYADAYVALQQTRSRVTPGSCKAVASAPTIRAVRGTRIVFSGQLQIVGRARGQTWPTQTYNSAAGNTVAVRAGPVELTVFGPRRGAPTLCRIETP